MGKGTHTSYAGDVRLPDDEFQEWLDRMLADARKKLGMTNDRLAYYLLREGLSCYYKAVWRTDAKDNT